MPQLRDPVAIKTLAENVRRYRTAKKITQETLANLVGIESSQISRIERGLINTSVSVVFAIAGALQIKASQLLEIPARI